MTSRPNAEFATLISECEEDLRVGRTRQVSKRLSGLNTSRIPRPYRQPLANICWRAGLISLGTKILAPVIRPGKIVMSPATAIERVEYSALLLRTGATSEALQLLESVDGDQTPEVLLYRAFCHFARWEHALAVPILRKYVQHDLPPCKKLVGNVNLAAALVSAEMYADAEELLVENIEFCRTSGYMRLWGNCLEISAQSHLFSGDFSRAKEDLSRASELLKSTETYDQFFVTKWRSILDALQNQDLAPLDRLRSEASGRGEWETLREADRFSLKIAFDEKILQRLVFGTPSDRYRSFIFKELPGVQLPETYLYGSEEGSVLNLKDGTIRGLGAKATSLKPGKKIFNLFGVLSQDFYRPMRLGALFSELFPNEHFDVYSSQSRVHSWLWQMRKWIAERDLPVTVDLVRGGYKLNLNDGFGIELPLGRQRVDAHSVPWERVVKKFGQREFSAKQAGEVTGLSRTSLQRFLTWALENRRLERHGSGKLVTYKLAQN